MNVNQCINIADLRLMAQKRLPKMIFDFLEGGADDEWTTRQNIEAFNRYPLMPRTLVDVGTINMETNLFNRRIDWPVIIAPVGALKVFHYSGEISVARAAAESGTFFSLSTMSTQSIEEISSISGGPKIFQVYVLRDRGLTEGLIERAKTAGYDALCMTVDTPLSGNRERDRSNGLNMPPKWTLRNIRQFMARPRWSFSVLFHRRIGLANFHDVSGAGQTTLEYVNSQFDRTLTWKDATWLAKKWNGPLAIKGIMSVEDAKRAVDSGVTTIWLSNHGGRQIDGVPATIDCLSSIRAAVGDKIDIIFDSGVVRGTQVIKAIAMGANACAIGRAYLYGLAAGGYVGVVKALEILRSELERDMALLGCPSLKDIGRHTLANGVIT